MKKLLVALLAICLVFSCMTVVSFAEDEAPTADTPSADAAEPTKTIDTKIGMFYLQGESGQGYLPKDQNGNEIPYNTTYDYTSAQQIAKAINGTKRVPFYATVKDGAVFFDRFAQQAFLHEMNMAAAAGVDFVAYQYHPGYGTINGTKQNLTFMNNQLKLHSTLASQLNVFDRPIDFCLYLDKDVETKDAEMIVDQYLVVKGYLQNTADSRPVIFYEFYDGVKAVIDKVNSLLAKAITNGANPKKKDPETLFPETVQSAFIVMVNAPDYDTAVANGADAVTWFEGSGSNGEAYANLVSRTEGNWSKGTAVVPNVVVGFDKSVLAANPIKCEAEKYAGSKAGTPTVRYERTGAATDTVAAATPEELVNHIKNAVATTNKPNGFNALVIYAWDDFCGGAYLCPTKTDKEYEYEYSYLKAMRKYFYGVEDYPEIMQPPYAPVATATPEATPVPEKKGCGALVALPVCLLGMGLAAVVIKKKED